MHEAVQRLLAAIKEHKVAESIPMPAKLKFVIAADLLEQAQLEPTQQEKIVERLRKLAVNHPDGPVILWLADEVERYEL